MTAEVDASEGFVTEAFKAERRSGLADRRQRYGDVADKLATREHYESVARDVLGEGS